MLGSLWGYDIGWFNDGDDLCHHTLIINFVAFWGDGGVRGAEKRLPGGSVVTSGISYITVRWALILQDTVLAQSLNLLHPFDM